MRKKKLYPKYTDEQALEKTRLVKLMREIQADTDILFGGGFNVTVFKDVFKITKFNANEMDIEAELCGKEHLNFDERRQYIEDLK